jgi:hypothetical protein
LSSAPYSQPVIFPVSVKVQLSCPYRVTSEIVVLRVIIPTFLVSTDRVVAGADTEIKQESKRNRRVVLITPHLQIRMVLVLDRTRHL